ncbi:MAG: hypothetical protein LCH35_13515 [Bacteroidetes bacterium]|uniref:hypothetical protein n=1 Tax=Flavobacterium sp. TaxID=239 RepID=UPI002FD90712|nr:hypothetical protein [Bacteroidota bacterium]
MKLQLKLAIITTLLSIMMYGQAYDRPRTFNYSGITAPERFISKISPATQGSPYIYTTFLLAKIENFEGVALLRYNANNDEFEFIDPSNDTLVLKKVVTFSKISFVANKSNYRLVEYTDKQKQKIFGYLVCLQENKDYSLIKRQKIDFYEPKEAKTSYDTRIPPRFERAKDTYFLKYKDQDIVEFPSNKKGLVKLYPDKKEAIETFIKQNKINFDKEEDLSKIIDFLAT